jgi:hypothetical protein
VIDGGVFLGPESRLVHEGATYALSLSVAMNGRPVNVSAPIDLAHEQIPDDDAHGLPRPPNSFGQRHT